MRLDTYTYKYTRVYAYAQTSATEIRVQAHMPSSRNYLHLRLSSMHEKSACRLTHSHERTPVHTCMYTCIHACIDPYMHTYLHTYENFPSRTLAFSKSIHAYLGNSSQSRKPTECTTHNAFIHKSSFTGQVQCLQRKLEAWAALARHSDFSMA